ncbi:MAG: haloacid dehalogenase-like hydrolase [candidate division Zixibacteria bacterium]|nr:haloacid dehalogenase-like hydrolase [candidate division Zixibacteria bacterium]MBU1469577.1 haloacid dehalogenase-like hydrolase [candidate division Zixibacteria bacterium]
MPDQVVFWDIDGTLIDGSLERCFLAYLRRHGHATIPYLARSAARLTLDWPPGWHKIKIAYLRGRAVEEVEQLLESCWADSILPDISSAAAATVLDLRERGARQILLSGTPRPLAMKMASYLRIADVIAADPEIRNGIYTGRLTARHPRGIRKVQYAQKWLNENGCTWGMTTGIADHWDDRFLLGRVHNAIAVAPGKRLRRLASSQGWVIQNMRDDLRSQIPVITASWNAAQSGSRPKAG